jgi:phosphatidylglycerophosphate synthase
MLWVKTEGSSVSPTSKILGLPIARRIALTARRAGFGRIVFEDVSVSVNADVDVGAESHSLAAALEGTGAEIVPEGTAPPDSRFGAVILPPGVLPRVRWLRDLAVGIATSGPGSFRIREAGDLPRAERWLLAGLIKDEEGFMSRHVERRISLAISRRLAGTRVTPNAMTLVSVAIGLVGAGCFLSVRPAWQLAGALLFLLHSILDGCDGELARLNFQESRFGGVLDFWGDNVVHSAVFGGIAAGRYLATGETWPLVAGASAIAGTLASAAFVYRTTMVSPKTGARPKDGPEFTSISVAPPTRVSRIADALARRDFIYLVVLLSAFGRAHWFLALAAVGAPLFFLVLVGVALYGQAAAATARQRRPGRSPQ